MLAQQGLGQLSAWAAGAQALSLLATAYERGWTSFLAEPRELDELATFSGLPADRTENVVAALEVNGVVERHGGRIVLTPAFEALVADDAWLYLGDNLDEAAAMTRLVRAAVEDADGVSLGDADAMAIAKAAGGRPTPVSRAVYERLYAQIPEFAQAIREGRLLDVGCGIAAAALTSATMFPGMRSVELEIVPAVAAEARARAEALGVADRVDVRCMDARKFDERDAFDAALWAQPFFVESARTETLAMIRRALKPGAILIIQEMDREPADDAERPAFAVRKLVYENLGARFASTAEQLIEEAEAAGFELDRLAVTDFGRIVIMRRPADG
ncbi:SAM-dependent methyltransferase [Nonomuraea maritima]|uniref:SAM-dependent methyltransferase n=1 Tax=Nonomuraea maritima TaxID=683260 RepID=UPI003714CD2D